MRYANSGGAAQTVKVLKESLHRYNFENLYIQDAMPELSADDREFLLSGYCQQCFSLLFEE